MPLVPRSFRRRLTLLFLISQAVGCHKLDDDDCQLFNTCSGTLFASFRRVVSKDCETCLKTECSRSATSCFGDFRCAHAVECMLKPHPLEYQKCLTELWEEELSTPDDAEGAWEGDVRLFTACLDDCQSECRRDRSDWSCLGWDEGKSDVDLTATVAVRLYRGADTQSHRPAPNVLVRDCTGEGCSPQGVTTNDAGIATLAVGPSEVTGVYFALEDQNEPPEFPPTYFYPGRLSSDPEQPIAIYLVASWAVWIANDRLLADSGVHVERTTGLIDGGAQSLILPDACREQEKPSALGVTLHARVDGAPLARCGEAIKRGSGATIPCIWYGSATNGYPEVDFMHTEGWGGGILGLPKGLHDVRVCDQDGGVVARRQLRMEPGWLTIARTWPLSRAEQASAGQCDRSDYSSEIVDAAN